MSDMEAFKAQLLNEACAALSKLRQGETSVHCIVGDIARAFTAETLQALGVSVLMTHDVREVDDFVDHSEALLVQLGTMSEMKEAGITTAVDTARRTGKPWVFEPRLANRSIFRAELARGLAENRPKIICGKSAELAALPRVKPATLDVIQLARAFRSTVLECGDQDKLSDPLRSAVIGNQSPAMDSVVAMDSAISAICAAFAAVESDGFKAAAGAILTARIAGERASAKTTGAGSFPIAFLDALGEIDAETLAASARIEIRANI